MTTQTPRSQHDDSEATRLNDLLRADAAAVIDDDLDDEASYHEYSAANSEPATKPVARRPRSQVYSIRVPVEKLGQLRWLARERGVAPTAMLREWALAQLEAEIGTRDPQAGEDPPEATSSAETRERSSGTTQDATTERLEQVVAILADLTAQLTRMMTINAELAARSISPAEPPGSVRMLSARSGNLEFPPWLAHSGTYSAIEGLMAASRLRARLAREGYDLTVGYVQKGLADLRTTVGDASALPGFGDVDLDTLYDAADDELSYP
jgi:hypothetical protein